MVDFDTAVYFGSFSRTIEPPSNLRDLTRQVVMAESQPQPPTPDQMPDSSTTNNGSNVTISREQYQQLLAAYRSQEGPSIGHQYQVELPYPRIPMRDGRTTYASHNARSGATFMATAPVGSRYAKQLREMTAAVQGESMSEVEQMAEELQRQRQLLPEGRRLEQQQDHRFIEAVPDTQQAIEECHDLQKPQTVNRVMNSESSPTALEWLTKKLRRGFSIERHETESEVMYYRQTSKGYCVVTAPIGSEEAGLYDTIMRIVKPRQVSLQISSNFENLVS
jgi:hypothetical protein